jgi:hypothetical protein
MPNVKEGSVIEYEYVQLDRHVQGTHWFFQTSIPVTIRIYNLRPRVLRS